MFKMEVKPLPKTVALLCLWLALYQKKNVEIRSHFGEKFRYYIYGPNTSFLYDFASFQR